VDGVLALQRKEALATATFYGSTGFAGNVTILALLGYGGSLVSKGLISVGDLSSLLLYSAYVGGSMGQLSSFFVSPSPKALHHTQTLIYPTFHRRHL